MVTVFQRNKERIIQDACKSVSSHFKKVKELIEEHSNTETEGKKNIFTGQVIFLHILISSLLLLIVVIFQEILQVNLFSSVDNIIYFYYIFNQTPIDFKDIWFIREQSLKVRVACSKIIN